MLNSEKLFAIFLDIEANKIAHLTGLSRPCIHRILKATGQRIAEFCENEIDESYFGARRVHEVRGRGARGKHIVFGLIKRQGRVYTQVVTNCSASTLLPIIREEVNENSAVYTDGFKSYDGLVDAGYKKHYRVKHGENEFAKGYNHINGIENFWGLVKTRFAKFRGISKNTFYLHFKECEFRFNYRTRLVFNDVKIIRNKPLKVS